LDVHDLTPGYALDALDPDERASYEEHLASCEACREELQGFWQVSGALARASGGPMPPPELRERILAEARSERSNVVPLRRRSVAVPVLSSVAAVAAVAVIGLGFWATSLSRDLDDTRSLVEVLEDPNARTVRSSGGEADLVVTPSGDAALVVRMLSPAPDGKDYEIWVFEDGTPRSAGLFEQPGAARLTRAVQPGQTVAVTLEPDGGVDAPTGDPIFTATST
jgi:anti-sigma-K factor RskA